MTILPWPADKPRRRPKAPRKMIIDPLPTSVLHHLVADLPGPKGETEAERAARFEAQLAEVKTFNPRDSAEAMLATHCVLMDALTKHTIRDATNPRLTPGVAKQCDRDAKEFQKLMQETKHALARRQAAPLGRMDAALCALLGLSRFLIPDPDEPATSEPAFSAIIVPLHSAPKMLQ